MRLSLFAVAALAAASQVSAAVKGGQCVLTSDAVFGDCETGTGPGGVNILKCIDDNETGGTDASKITCQAPACDNTCGNLSKCETFKDASAAQDLSGVCSCEDACAIASNTLWNQYTCEDMTDTTDGKYCKATAPVCVTTVCKPTEYCVFQTAGTAAPSVCKAYVCADACAATTQDCIDGQDADDKTKGTCGALVCATCDVTENANVCVRGANGADNRCEPAKCDAVVGDCKKVDAAVADCKIDQITAKSYCACNDTKKCGAGSKCTAAKCELDCKDTQEVKQNACSDRECKKVDDDKVACPGVCLAKAGDATKSECVEPSCKEDCTKNEEKPVCSFNGTNYAKDTGICTAKSTDSATRVGADRKSVV